MNITSNYFIFRVIGNKLQALPKYRFFILFIVLTGLFQGQVLAQNRKVTLNFKAYNRLDFNYFDDTHDLSQFAITSLLQDKDGFMWIGTYNGLYRYDGFTIVPYRHTFQNTASLIANRIYCMAEKSNDEIWIGSEDGLMSYNKATGKVTDFSFVTAKLHTSFITALYVDSQKNLWIGSDKGVVYGQLLPDGNYKFTESIYMKEKYTTSFCEDVNKNIWIATQTGVYYGRWKTMDIVAQLIEFTKNRVANVIFRDRSGRMLIGGKDIFSVVKISNGKLQIQHLYANIFKNETTSVIGLTEDTINSGLWVGTGTKGLYFVAIDESNNVSRSQYFNDTTFNGRLTHNDIAALTIDKSNVLWVGTRKGVNHANLTHRKFNNVEPLLSHAYNNIGYKGEYINSLFVDNDQKLWISTYKKGLYYFDPVKQVMTNISSKVTNKSVFQMVQNQNGDMFFASIETVFQLRKNKNSGSFSNAVKIEIPGVNLRTRFKGSILLDKFNNLWIRTAKGIVKYNPENKRYIEYSTTQGLPPITRVYQIYQDPFKPVIWLFDEGSGVTKISYNAGYVIQVELMVSKTQLANNYVWDVLIDRSKRMWLGTDTGIDLITFGKNGSPKVEHILQPLLRNIKVLSIIEDNRGSLWFGSNQGLYNYNPATHITKKYSYEDGLQSNSYTEAIEITKDGVVYIGGTSGLNYFNPDQLTNNKFLSMTAFTALRCHNQSVEIGKEFNGSVILNQDINKATKITLNHKQNDFTIEFASLHFAAPLLNKYKYQLEGYDTAWIQVDQSHRYASYSNLPSGKYKFKLISSNNDEVWNKDPKTLQITILPPPWKTFWAYSAYLLIFGLIIYFVIRYLLERQKWRNDLIIQKIESEKVEALNEMKLNFFTNITHEFRTPLVLILGPLRDLIENSKNYDEYLTFRHNIIYKNSQKLLSLINQVLNIRKMSTDKLPLSIRQNQLDKVVTEMVNHFRQYAGQKNINLLFKVEGDISDAWFDQDKIEKVIQNVISNALKYTPEGGEVTIFLRTTQELINERYCRHAEIIVKDNGIGIAKNQLEKIFDMFYTVNQGFDNSTGIGLAFSQLLMQSHLGRIKVESTQGEGSQFFIIFPIEKSCFDAGLIVDTPLVENIDVEIPEITENNNRTILIVEDNDDMRSYIRESLKSDFRIIEAVNGKEGLVLARKHLPNAIICDLMMPEIDGMTLIENLREDTRTNYIPIIVHSVKDDNETITKALESGAYEYIVKPLDPVILIRKLKSLLDKREEYAKKIKNDQTIVPSEISLDSSDLQLLKRIIHTIEENIQNNDLDAEMISSNIGMSRMQLYRRLKTMIGGKQISEIILEVRLKRAAQLLASGEKRISEVMYETGFTNNTRFKTYFTNFYHVTPAEYIKQHS